MTAKTIRENAFEQKKKKPGLSANWPSKNWALNVYFGLNGFQSSRLLIYCGYGLNTCSHCTKVCH